MWKAIWKNALFVILIGSSPIYAQKLQPSALDGSTQPRAEDHLQPFRDPSYSGKPLSYWLKSIRNRDDEMGLAFEAIKNLGPAASLAVPELTRVVSEPVTPIQVGIDGFGTVTEKLRAILIHSRAVDCLGAIGPSAAPSASALVEWALTPKVVLRGIRNREEQDAFVDLVGIDVVERMRVVGAISKFRPAASTLIAKMLKSPDEDTRKLGVSILGENALPVAVTLLKSADCSEQELGFNILFDMWSVVARDHLFDLIDVLPCIAPEDHDQ